MTRECVTPLMPNLYNSRCLDRGAWAWWMEFLARDPRKSAAVIARVNPAAELAKHRRMQCESMRAGRCLRTHDACKCTESIGVVIR
jgi:hypothetical protein